MTGEEVAMMVAIVAGTSTEGVLTVEEKVDARETGGVSAGFEFEGSAFLPFLLVVDSLCLKRQRKGPFQKAYGSACFCGSYPLLSK